VTRDLSAGSGEYDTVEEMGLLYDHVAPYRQRADVAFYVSAARRAQGRVLELGCGTGRILLPIARAGVRVVGVDRSSAMLARCQAKVAAESAEVRQRIQLVEGDMRQLDLAGAFSAVLMPFRSMQHQTTVEDQLATLDSVRRHLVAGGSLVLDVFHPALARLASPSTEEQEDTPPTQLPDGRTFRRTARVTAVDTARQVSNVEIAYYVTSSGGAVERRVQAFPMRWFFRYELEHLLVRSGFMIEAVYGDFDRSPLTAGSAEIIVDAQKVERSDVTGEPAAPAR
jgi:SAM-dependent methyltransferase